MNIRRSIACMALMISTGYASSMDPNEPYGNLSKKTTYTKDKEQEFQKPGDKSSMLGKTTINQAFVQSSMAEDPLNKNSDKIFTGNFLESLDLEEYTMFPEEVIKSVEEKYKSVGCEGNPKLSNLINEMESRQEIEYLETLLHRLNADGFKDNDGQPLTINSFNTIAGPVKAKFFLTQPTLADVGGNEKDLEIALEIAERMIKPFSLFIDELVKWNMKMVALIYENKKYKDAIIKYSYNEGCIVLRDNNSNPLTEQTFDKILAAVKAKFFLTQHTLEDVGNNEEDFKIAKKIAFRITYYAEKALKNELRSWNSAMMKFVAENKKYVDAIIEFSAGYEEFLDNNGKPLTPQTFYEILGEAKAKLLLTKPTLEDVGGNKEYFKIAMEIANMDPEFCKYVYLIHALSKLDPEALKFIESNEKYKNAIIEYSAVSNSLKDHEKKPLTKEMFNKIVGAAKARLLSIKNIFEDVVDETNHEIVNNIIKRMINPKNRFSEELDSFNRKMLEFIDENSKCRNAIIEYSAKYNKLLDNNQKPLKEDTFNEIVNSKLTKIENGKEECKIY